MTGKNYFHADASIGKNLAEWSAHDEAFLLWCVLGWDDALSVFDVARYLERDPLVVLRHLVSGEVMDMIGLDGSQPEVVDEIFGVALAGVPLVMVLKWCAADPDEETRVSWDSVESAMLWPDLRAGFALARRLGLWVHSSLQLESLRFLSTQEEGDVKAAVSQVSARMDVPLPSVIAQALFGVISAPCGYPWVGSQVALSCSPTRPAAKRKSGKRTPTRTIYAAGRAKSGRRRSTRGASYPVGAAGFDTRSAADRAWELRTHW